MNTRYIISGCIQQQDCYRPSPDLISYVVSYVQTTSYQVYDTVYSNLIIRVYELFWQ